MTVMRTVKFLKVRMPVWYFLLYPRWEVLNDLGEQWLLQLLMQPHHCKISWPNTGHVRRGYFQCERLSHYDSNATASLQHSALTAVQDHIILSIGC